MVRCVDETCQESDNNAVLDISPYSMDDPMIWFKVNWSLLYSLETIKTYFDLIRAIIMALFRRTTESHDDDPNTANQPSIKI